MPTPGTSRPGAEAPPADEEPSGDARSHIRWVGRADGRERPLPVGVVSLSTGAEWAGLRLEETRSRPGELPEGHLPSHLVVLNLHRPIRTETSWPERRSRSEIIVAPGGVTVFPAGLPFVTRWRDPLENVVVELSPAFVASVLGEDAPAPELRPALASEDALVAHVVLALRELARAGNDHDPLQAEALGTVLATRLLRRYGASSRAPAELRGALPANHFERVVAYVNERLAEPLTLHDLAGVAGMSVYRFARLFKACAGVAPHH
ncbi:MAG TPA: AraC family transcriptional regulator, partial [Anaeromyxobacteraceae bacterium]|nr:AraC family transcriptional regulator [Anaeromyxobacteraceae bacterium]